MRMDKCSTALARCVPSVTGMGGIIEVGSFWRGWGGGERLTESKIWSSEMDGWKDWIWLRRSPYYKVPAGMGAWVEERVAKRHNRDPMYPINPERSERTGIVKDSRHKQVFSVRIAKSARQLDGALRADVGKGEWNRDVGLATRSPPCVFGNQCGDFASTCADPWTAPMFGSAHFRKAEEEPCRHAYGSNRKLRQHTQNRAVLPQKRGCPLEQATEMMGCGIYLPK
nr:hypothetical protein B9J10.60 [imported] - Neurospora crassa [Neurospora crassa]